MNNGVITDIEMRSHVETILRCHSGVVPLPRVLYPWWGRAAHPEAVCKSAFDVMPGEASWARLKMKEIGNDTIVYKRVLFSVLLVLLWCSHVVQFRTFDILALAMPHHGTTIRFNAELANVCQGRARSKPSFSCSLQC